MAIHLKDLGSFQRDDKYDTICIGICMELLDWPYSGEQPIRSSYSLAIHICMIFTIYWNDPYIDIAYIHVVILQAAV